MIHIAQAIVVEGKYDKIKLSSILDAVILVTNGFRIFRDPEKMALIQYYARTTGRHCASPTPIGQAFRFGIT